MASLETPTPETIPYNMLVPIRYRAQWDRINDAIGVGLIAPKDIKAGELIFVENGAVFLQNPEEKEVRPWHGLAQLDEEHFKNYILRLIVQADKRAQLIHEFIGDGTVKGLDYPQDAEDCLFRPAYPEAIINRKRFDAIWQESEVSENVLWDQEALWRLMGRFFGDTVCVPDHDGKVQYALGLLTSLMNHSCLPNATMFFDGYNKPIDEDNPIIQIRMQAVKDIKAGEEVTRCYRSGPDTFHEHLDLLQFDFGFQCCCNACLDAEKDPLINDLRQTVYDLKIPLENNFDELSYAQFYRCGGLCLDACAALGMAHETIPEIYRKLYMLALSQSDAIRAYYFMHKALEWYGKYLHGGQAKKLMQMMRKVLLNDTHEHAVAINGYSYLEDFDREQPELEELMFMMRHRSDDQTYYCLHIVDGKVEELSARINSLVQERAAQALLRLNDIEAMRRAEEIAQEEAKKKKAEEVARKMAREEAQKKSVEELAREIEGVSEDTPSKKKKKSKSNKKKTATSLEQGSSSTNPTNSTAEQGIEMPLMDTDVVEDTRKKEVADLDSPGVVVTEKAGMAEKPEPRSPNSRQQGFQVVNTVIADSPTNTAITGDSAKTKNDPQFADDKAASEKQVLRDAHSPNTLKTEQKSPTTCPRDFEVVKIPRREAPTTTVITNGSARLEDDRQVVGDKTAPKQRSLRVSNSPGSRHDPKPTFKVTPGASTTLDSPAEAARSTGSKHSNSVVAPGTSSRPASTRAPKKTLPIPQPLVEPALPQSLTVSSTTTIEPTAEPPMMPNPLYDQEGEGWDIVGSHRTQKQQAKLSRPAPAPVRREVSTPHFTRPTEASQNRSTPTMRVRGKNRGQGLRLKFWRERAKELESRNAFLEAVAGIVAEEDALAEPWVCPFGAKDGVSKQAWLASDGSKEALRLNPRDVGHLLAAKDGIGARLEGFMLRARRDSACGRLQGDKAFVDRGRLRAHSFGNDASKEDVLKLAEVRESKEF